MHHVRHVNDTTESSLFESGMRRLMAADTDPAFVGYLDLMLSERGDLYLATFCREDDLLSMWRSFPRGDGFSLRFDQTRLIRDAEGHRAGSPVMVHVKGSFARLNDVIYGNEAVDRESRRIYGLMRGYYDRWRTNGSPPVDETPASIRAALKAHNGMVFTEQREDLLRHMYIHKHFAFREEKERRWVIPLQPAVDVGVMPYLTEDFRQYLKLGFEPAALLSIRISPFASPSVYPGLRQFLDENGLGHVSLEYSSATGVVR